MHKEAMRKKGLGLGAACPEGRDTRARRTDPIEQFSNQQLDLSHSQAFPDQIIIDLKPEQATGIACRLGLDHDSPEH
jgi:hypothetical protein